MNTDTIAKETNSGSSGLKIFLIVLVTIIVTAALTFWVVRTYIFPAEFKPVQLSASEQQVLEQKLERIDSIQSRPALYPQIVLQSPPDGSGQCAVRRQWLFPCQAPQRQLGLSWQHVFTRCFACT